jgi:DNA-binding transcriptional LysR family regulator
MDKWAELRTAYQVAKLGTVSAAADALGYHRATVNRHVDVLEAEIGTRIFIRHARGYTLTDVGEDVLRVAQKTESLIDDLAGRVHGGQAQFDGEIKVTILAPFAGLLMAPIAAFRAQNPLCLVEIDASEDLARLEYGEAHIAVRAGAKPNHPDYVVSSFGRVGFNLYAHDRYVQKHGLPTGADDLEGHKFVIPHTNGRRLPFSEWIEEHVSADMIAMSSRDIWVLIEAISAGIGLGFMGDHEAQNRRNFHPVFPPNRLWSVPVWLVTHVDLHRTQKVQAMLKCLKSAAPSGSGRT